MTSVKQAPKSPGAGPSGGAKLGKQAAPGGKPRVRIQVKPTTGIAVKIGEASIDFQVLQNQEGPVFFSLGVRKSGSTMLHKIVNFLATRNAINIVNIPDTFFRNGFTVANWNPLDLSKLIAPGNIYTGFRTFPSEIAKTSLYADALKVFMFRDPRDALVSQYFSDAYSHDIPTQEAAGDGREIFLKKRDEAKNADIDEWVLGKVGGILRTLLACKDALDDPKCLVLRYEDYVFQKKRMIGKIVQHFGWTIDQGAIQKLLSEVDVLPDAEDKSRFVRRVIPGDHAAKLKPETVRRLNRRLAEVMTLYDYY